MKMVMIIIMNLVIIIMIRNHTVGRFVESFIELPTYHKSSLPPTLSSTIIFIIILLIYIIILLILIIIITYLIFVNFFTQP